MGDISLKIKSGDYAEEYQDNDFVIAGAFKENEDEMPKLSVDIRGAITASQFYDVICGMYSGVLMAIPKSAAPKFMVAMRGAAKYAEALLNTKFEITLVKKEEEKNDGKDHD